MAPEQVTEATILAVVPDGNGWTKIQTDVGDFSTKFAEPIAEAQAHIGQRGLVAYEMGQARQKNDGSGWWPAPRYFKRITATSYQQPQPQAFAGQQQQPQPVHPSVQAFQERMQAQPQTPPPQQPQGDPAREQRIMRQTAGKLAVQTMALVPSEQRTFQNQIAVAEAWLRYFIGGPDGVPVTPAQPMPQQPAAPTQEQQMAMMGQSPDDDIPF